MKTELPYNIKIIPISTDEFGLRSMLEMKISDHPRHEVIRS